MEGQTTPSPKKRIGTLCKKHIESESEMFDIFSPTKNAKTSWKVGENDDFTVNKQEVSRKKSLRVLLPDKYYCYAFYISAYYRLINDQSSENVTLTCLPAWVRERV